MGPRFYRFHTSCVRYRYNAAQQFHKKGRAEADQVVRFWWAYGWRQEEGRARSAQRRAGPQPQTDERVSQSAQDKRV